MDHEIEIMPGFKVEETPTLRKMARLSARGNLKEFVAAMRVKAPTGASWRSALAHRARNKHSLTLIKEAIFLKRKKGMEYAVRKTGINQWTIKKKEDLMEHRGEIPRRKNVATSRNTAKYTVEQKLACIAAAKRLMATGLNRADSFLKAGRMTGVNGLSIKQQWTDGYLNPGLSTQQPSASLGVSGLSIHAAKPQTQP